MAQSLVTDAGTLIIPGAYSTIKVQTNNSGLATTGVLMLVGEADAGPRFSLETDLEENSFGPDQVAAVQAKYRSGPIVDAFRVAAAPAADPGIPGAPSRIVIVKTNSSLKAKRAITNWSAATYGFLADKSYGKLGNLIYVSVEAKQAEVLPTTGSFTFIPAVGTVAFEIRVNGGAGVGGTLVAADSPATFVSTVNSLAGVAATGGADRVAHSDAGTIAITATGNAVVFTAAGDTWQVTPSIGDTLVVPPTSVLAGGSNQNVGAYVVTGATTTTIAATKLSDAAKPGATIGVITAPLTIGATAVGGTPANNIKVFSPVIVTLEAGNPIDGIGKSLEIAELTSGTDLLSRTAYQLNTTVVTWVSKAATATNLTATEYVAKLNVNRQSDAVQEELSAGGEIALKIRYTGTTATITVGATSITTSVAGGAGANLDIALSDFATLNDLANFISVQPGYSCSVGNGILGQLPPSALDKVTAQGICSAHGAQNGRLKVDAYKFFKVVSEQSVLVQLQNSSDVVVAASSGLPQPQTTAYLAGGARGGTLSTDIVAAIDALEKVSGNFLIPLFSRDATTDILDNLTDSSSTYTIDAINAYAKTHVIKLSTLKRKKNRQAFLSKKSSFSAAKEASSNIAHHRCTMTFQDIKVVASDGTIKQFQPWMGAVVAAGMQAAGFYRAIFGKLANISGAIQGAADFDDRDDTAMEDALLNGLLPLKREPTGGFSWVSDQTTYGTDNNFVYNSIQATYGGDIIALTTAQRMEKAFKGQSIADVSAGVALSFLEVIMSELLKLKLLAPSSDAPKGFKDPSIKINGPVMYVSCEVKLAGAIYFIPISFLVSQVTQSA